MLAAGDAVDDVDAGPCSLDTAVAVSAAGAFCTGAGFVVVAACSTGFWVFAGVGLATRLIVSARVSLGRVALVGVCGV